MRRVIYASTSYRALTSGELDQIASQAQTNNAPEGITGMLLYGDHSFFQVLEGPTENIKKMKRRIWEDSRHRGISELQDKPIEAAAFSEWSMGCYRVDSVETDSTHWKIVDFDSIESHLPEGTPVDILVLARTFFSSISPRGVVTKPQ